MSTLQSGVPSSVAENTPVDDFRIIPPDQYTDAPPEQEAVAVESPPSAPVVQAPVSNEPRAESPKEQNFEAFRNEIKDKISKIDELERARQSERNLYEQELALLKSRVQQTQYPESRKEGVFKEFEDDYVPSVRELRQAFNEHDKDLRDKIDELQTMQAYPDYQKALQEDLVPFIKDKPHFVQMIAQAPNKAKAAYDLALMARQARTPATPPAPPPVQQPPQGTSPSEIAQRIVDNANKPGSLASAGGTGGGLSKADYYASMSDADFARLAKQNLSSF